MNYEEPFEIAYDFASESGIESPVLLDTYGTYYNSYDMSRFQAYAPFPQHIIVDADGLIQYTNRQYDADAMFSVLDTLVD